MIRLYTSYFYKMLTREKKEGDIYISIARSIGYCPKKGLHGESIYDLIDVDWGGSLGNYSGLENYENDLDPDFLQKIYEWLTADDYGNADRDIFFLCIENLNSKYTAKDELRNPNCKKGTFKKCHRTIFAKVMKEKYNLNITEYEGD